MNKPDNPTHVLTMDGLPILSGTETKCRDAIGKFSEKDFEIRPATNHDLAYIQAEESLERVKKGVAGEPEALELQAVLEEFYREIQELVYLGVELSVWGLRGFYSKETFDRVRCPLRRWPLPNPAGGSGAGTIHPRLESELFTGLYQYPYRHGASAVGSSPARWTHGADSDSRTELPQNNPAIRTCGLWLCQLKAGSLLVEDISLEPFSSHTPGFGQVRICLDAIFIKGVTRGGFNYSPQKGGPTRFSFPNEKLFQTNQVGPEIHFHWG